MAIRGRRWVTASVASQGPKKKDVGGGGWGAQMDAGFKRADGSSKCGELNGIWLGGTFSVVQ